MGRLAQPTASWGDRRGSSLSLLVSGEGSGPTTGRECCSSHTLPHKLPRCSSQALLPVCSLRSQHSLVASYMWLPMVWSGRGDLRYHRRWRPPVVPCPPLSWDTLPAMWSLLHTTQGHWGARNPLRHSQGTLLSTWQQLLLLLLPLLTLASPHDNLCISQVININASDRLPMLKLTCSILTSIVGMFENVYYDLLLTLQ